MEANGSPSHISTKIRLFILDYLDRAHKSFVGRYEAGRRLEIVEFVSIALALKADPREGLDLVINCMGGK